MTDEAVEVAVTIACPAWTDRVPDAADVAVRAAVAAYSGAGRLQRSAEASIVLENDEALRTLNRDYRGKDAPTNVLSFPGAFEAPVDEEAPVLLGDIVVALETTAREAEEHGKTLADHLSHLVVHGMLHLMGYDHESEEEAIRMERLEAEVLNGLGIADPYGG